MCFGPSGELFGVPIYAINLPSKYGAVKDTAAEIVAETVPLETLLVNYAYNKR